MSETVRTPLSSVTRMYESCHGGARWGWVSPVTAAGGVRLRRGRPGPPARPRSTEAPGAAAALPGLRGAPSGAPVRVTAGGRAEKLVRGEEPVLPFSSGSVAEETAASPSGPRYPQAAKSASSVLRERTECTPGSRRRPAGISMTAASSLGSPGRSARERPADGVGREAELGAETGSCWAGAGRWEGPAAETGAGRREGGGRSPSQQPLQSGLGSEEAAACAQREDGTPGDLAPARGRRPGGQQGRCESRERRAGSGARSPGARNHERRAHLQRAARRALAQARRPALPQPRRVRHRVVGAPRRLARAGGREAPAHPHPAARQVMLSLRPDPNTVDGCVSTAWKQEPKRSKSGGRWLRHLLGRQSICHLF
ncbi:uncharacterized protein RBU33_002306 [Hipposideros larvatus]